MANVVCAWAHLSDEAVKWYEDEWIPLMTSKHCQHTVHCEQGSSGFDEEKGTLDVPWKICTFYELRPDATKIEDIIFDRANHPPPEIRAGIMKGARLDIRAYTELRRWQADDWSGDDITSVAVMEWRIAPADHDQVMDYYVNKAVPTITKSPDVLRFRLLKLHTASRSESDGQKILDTSTLDTYLTLCELATEDWPWDVVVALAEQSKWREYFETQSVVSWKTSHFLVTRSYPEDGHAARYDEEET